MMRITTKYTARRFYRASARLDRLVRRAARAGTAASHWRLFVLALAAFRLVPQQFFPSSDRPELLVDLRLPEGASFEATLREAQRFETTMAHRPEIDHYIDFVGAGAPRFYLPLDQQLASPNFDAVRDNGQKRARIASAGLGAG